MLDLLKYCVFPSTREIEKILFLIWLGKADQRTPPFGGKMLKRIKNEVINFPLFPFLTKYFHAWTWHYNSFPGQKYQSSSTFPVTQSKCLSNSGLPFYYCCHAHPLPLSGARALLPASQLPSQAFLSVLGCCCQIRLLSSCHFLAPQICGSFILPFPLVKEK